MAQTKKERLRFASENAHRIEGFDRNHLGGLPKAGPPSLPETQGCGKTAPLGMEFLARGALQFNEPGVMLSFEETPKSSPKIFRRLGLR